MTCAQLSPPVTPPESKHELLLRSEHIAGLTLGDLAEYAGIVTPQHFKKEKGWTGQLLELWLGATAGSKPTQDFPELGIELKTIPVDECGNPLETTYVCYAPLTNTQGIRWETSNVKNKLRHVLWLPIQGNRDIPPKDRSVGTGFLWQPNEQQETLLRDDWEELMDLIALGHIESVTAKTGEVLQLRPKAADGKVLTDAIGPDGTRIKTRPRGFYLRKQFTKSILQSQFNSHD